MQKNLNLKDSCPKIEKKRSSQTTLFRFQSVNDSVQVNLTPGMKFSCTSLRFFKSSTFLYPREQSPISTAYWALDWDPNPTTCA
ncbi:hypothetical protein AVEN_111372-1 [Araneus ventricosus]|uniref:Uncharacterized protein n=1 Tax=Araneus ventricosus TaxID=182803 RepID=A0A4Y2REK9_ARAVE|nr:hypothetical protein AVEN_111372-1 [Araneus ventricosus]